MAGIAPLHTRIATASYFLPDLQGLMEHGNVPGRT